MSFVLCEGKEVCDCICPFLGINYLSFVLISLLCSLALIPLVMNIIKSIFGFIKQDFILVVIESFTEHIMMLLGWFEVILEVWRVSLQLFEPGWALHASLNQDSGITQIIVAIRIFAGWDLTLLGFEQLTDELLLVFIVSNFLDFFGQVSPRRF